MTVLQILVGGAVALIVAAGGWVVAIAVRREQTQVERAAKSGTIRTSEASELWAEADRIREWQSGELEKRDAQISELRGDVEECRKVCEDVRREVKDCERREKALLRQLAERGL